MGKAEQLSVELSSGFIDAAESAIAGGEFASLEHVVHAALADWQRRRQDDLAHLKTLVDEGRASGFEPHDGMDPIKREGRRLLADSRR